MITDTRQRSLLLKQAGNHEVSLPSLVMLDQRLKVISSILQFAWDYEAVILPGLPPRFLNETSRNCLTRGRIQPGQAAEAE